MQYLLAKFLDPIEFFGHIFLFRVEHFVQKFSLQ